jgi:hypothetical protein
MSAFQCQMSLSRRDKDHSAMINCQISKLKTSRLQVRAGCAALDAAILASKIIALSGEQAISNP